MTESLLISSVKSGFDVPSVFLNDFTYISSLSRKFPESKAFRYLSGIKPTIETIKKDSDLPSMTCDHCKQTLSMDLIYEPCVHCAKVRCMYCVCNRSLSLPKCCTVSNRTTFFCPGCKYNNRNPPDFIYIRCPNHSYLCKRCWMLINKSPSFACPVANCSTIFDQKAIKIWEKLGIIICMNCRRLKIKLYSEFPCMICSVCIDCQPDDIKHCIYCKSGRERKNRPWNTVTSYIPKITTI